MNYLKDSYFLPLWWSFLFWILFSSYQRARAVKLFPFFLSILFLFFFFEVVEDIHLNKRGAMTFSIGNLVHVFPATEHFQKGLTVWVNCLMLLVRIKLCTCSDSDKLNVLLFQYCCPL